MKEPRSLDESSLIMLRSVNNESSLSSLPLYSKQIDPTMRDSRSTSPNLALFSSLTAIPYLGRCSTFLLLQARAPSHLLSRHCHLFFITIPNASIAKKSSKSQAWEENSPFITCNPPTRQHPLCHPTRRNAIKCTTPPLHIHFSFKLNALMREELSKINIYQCPRKCMPSLSCDGRPRAPLDCNKRER